VHKSRFANGWGTQFIYIFKLNFKSFMKLTILALVVWIRY